MPLAAEEKPSIAPAPKAMPDSKPHSSQPAPDAPSEDLPLPSPSTIEEANFHMLREHQCTLIWVDACQRGKTVAKSWAFGCNSPRVQARRKWGLPQHGNR